jgi:putative toxin-antitoxin system antitoxin component (TIGR02293 family)
MPVQPATVERLLGIESARPSPLALTFQIRDGLPLSALDLLAGAVAPDDNRFKYRIIAKATLDRRRKSPAKRLTSDEGDRIARIAKVFSFALEVYHTDEKAREFLARPHPMLEGQTPLDIALAGSPGADLVINLLGRAAYGGGV